MYPPKFDYVAPTSLDDALSLLDQHSDDAKVLAGGQSLIPVLKLRFANPELLIDVNRIDGLGEVRQDNGTLHIGALARHNALGANALLRDKLPVMHTCGRWVADPIVRNLGTIGGSVVHSDPRGDWSSVMLALNATLVLSRKGSQRQVAMTDFIQGMFMVDIEPEELLTELRVPMPRGRTGGTYIKLERKIGDYATAAAAVHLELDGDRIARAGIGLTAVGPHAIKATDAEQALAGQAPSASLFAKAADLAAAASRPDDDNRGSAAYKRAVIREFVLRGLQQSLDIATA